MGGGLRAIAKVALVLTGMGLLAVAVVTDWRVVLLMLGAWWADNILKRLVERDG